MTDKRTPKIYGHGDEFHPRPVHNDETALTRAALRNALDDIILLTIPGPMTKEQEDCFGRVACADAWRTALSRRLIEIRAAARLALEHLDATKP